MGRGSMGTGWGAEPRSPLTPCDGDLLCVLLLVLVANCWQRSYAGLQPSRRRIGGLLFAQWR